MRALVSGCAGFIGSHLAEACLAKGWEVHGIDNFSTGRKENIPQGVSTLNCDIIAADAVLGAGYDYIFHLAAKADIVPSIEKPLAYHFNNCLGTAVILEYARTKGCKKFIYAASSTCYGSEPHCPSSEDDRIDPRYPYALTKWQGEETVMHYGRLYKLPVISLRLFNVYGRRARTSGAYGAVMGVFCKQKLENKPLTIVGDSSQRRDFTNVKDVVQAFILAAESPVKQEIFNIGTGKPQSVERLADMIGGNKFLRVNMPWRAGEPRETCADFSKAARLLNWRPLISFERGMNEIVEHIEDWRSAPLWDKESIMKATEQWHKYMGVSE